MGRVQTFYRPRNQKWPVSTAGAVDGGRPARWPAPGEGGWRARRRAL